MKLLKRVFTVAFICLAMCIGFAACSEEAIIERIEYQSGLKTTYYLGEVVSTASPTIKVYYSNGKTDTINTGITATGLNTEVSGEQTIAIKWGAYTIYRDITVSTELDPLAKIVGYKIPDEITKYKANKLNISGKFKTTTDGYYVGADNSFVMFPQAAILKSNNQGFFAKYESKIEVKLSTDGGITFGDPLANDVLETYLTFTPATGKFDFKTPAIGKTFEITMTAQDGDEFEAESLVHVVNVIEGWNVYNIEDLSRFDNTTGTVNGINFWADWKAERGITETPSAMILHKDLEIKKADLPQAFFHSNGALVNFVSIFNRDNPESANKEFMFIGNYFNIDASSMPLTRYSAHYGEAVDVNEEVKENQSMLFGLGSDKDCTDHTIAKGKVTLKNFSAYGNANRDEVEEKISGLTLIQTSSNVGSYIENISASAFRLMVLAVENSDNRAATNVNNCIFKDTFSTTFGVWRAEINVTNSKITGSGGPIFAMHYAGSAGDDMYPTVNVDSATVLTSELNGGEAWFAMSAKDLVAIPIPAMADAYNGNIIALSGGTKSLFKPGTQGNIMNILQALIFTGTDNQIADTPSGIFTIDGVPVLNAVPSGINLSNTNFLMLQTAKGAITINPDNMEPQGDIILANDLDMNVLKAILMNPAFGDMDETAANDVLNLIAFATGGNGLGSTLNLSTIEGMLVGAQRNIAIATAMGQGADQATAEGIANGMMGDFVQNATDICTAITGAAMATIFNADYITFHLGNMIVTLELFSIV